MTVVDTNVVAYLWLPGDFTAAAERLLVEDSDWAVPLPVAVGVLEHSGQSRQAPHALAGARRRHRGRRGITVAGPRVLG